MNISPGGHIQIIFCIYEKIYTFEQNLLLCFLVVLVLLGKKKSFRVVHVVDVDEKKKSIHVCGVRMTLPIDVNAARAQKARKSGNRHRQRTKNDTILFIFSFSIFFSTFPSFFRRFIIILRIFPLCHRTGTIVTNAIFYKVMHCISAPTTMRSLSPCNTLLVQ